MTREQLFEIWAPPRGRWSPWAKPVVFAGIGAVITSETSLPIAAAPTPPEWAPPASQNAALVLDLPGPQAVDAALDLAAAGYRPVPLYNAQPGPPGPPEIALVDVHSIARSLLHVAGALTNMRISDDAPPAFLLDANRRLGVGPLIPGRFDNRSVSFPTDFPSASFLLAHGIRRALLIQNQPARPQPDLAHTLRRWHADGVAVSLASLDPPTEPVPCPLARPSRLALWWHHLTAAIGLRRSPLGGFGGLIPDPSAG